MATYTVTRVITRPNTSTQWPREVLDLTAYDNLSEKVSRGPVSYDSDDLVQTSCMYWKSKEDYINNLSDADNPEPTLVLNRNQYNTYMVLNNITGEVTEEDGTVRIFNSSNKAWEKN